jgi:hypothetical protein
MAERMVSDTNPIGLAEIVATMGELYLVGLAILILLAAMANIASVPTGISIIQIDDPAIAAAFTG